jgi:hypothetical protein
METYPLTFPERPRTTGFWIAFPLCAFVASFIPAFMWVNEVVTSLETVQLMMRISRGSADMRFGFRDDQRI